MKAASKAHSRMCLFTQYVGTLWKSLLQDAVDTTSSQGLKPAKQMYGKRTKKCNKDTAPESPPNNKLWDTGEHLGDVSLYICLQVMLFACVISHCWRQAAGLQEPLVWHGTAVPVDVHFCLVGTERSSRLPAVSARGNTSAWIRLHPTAGCAWSGIDILLKMRLGRDLNLGISPSVQTLACTHHISALKNVSFTLKITFHTQRMEIWHNTLCQNSWNIVALSQRRLSPN